jgi:hypothetical protein
VGPPKLEPLSTEDACILGLETGTVRGHTCKIIVFEGEHDDHAVRAAIRLRDAVVGWYRDAFFRDLGHLSRSLERSVQRWAMRPRVFTLNVSNVPGPQGPQTVLGSPLLELHSFAEIAHRHALRVAVVSAAGRISVGLCADPDAIGGLGVIADGIEREIEALGAAVGGPR